MISTAAAIWIGIAAALLGAALGVLAYRLFHPDGKRKQTLEAQLKEAEQKYSSYQQEVTEHFAETARRVNSLTAHYKDVHEYLASSATKLTNPALSREFLEGAQRNLPREPVVVESVAEPEVDIEAGDPMPQTDERDSVASETNQRRDFEEDVAISANAQVFGQKDEIQEDQSAIQPGEHSKSPRNV